MFQRLGIVLSQSPMLPSLIVLFICTSYKDVKVFHPHRWLDYMRSVLFRTTPSIDTVTNFYPWGRWVDSAPHTSRFRSSWILVINVLIQNLLFSVGFHFFPQGSFGDLRLRYCGDDILVQQQKFYEILPTFRNACFSNHGGSTCIEDVCIMFIVTFIRQSLSSATK